MSQASYYKAVFTHEILNFKVHVVRQGGPVEIYLMFLFCMFVVVVVSSHRRSRSCYSQRPGHRFYDVRHESAKIRCRTGEVCHPDITVITDILYIALTEVCESFMPVFLIVLVSSCCKELNGLASA